MVISGRFQDALTPENLRFLGFYALGLANGLVAILLIAGLRRHRPAASVSAPLPEEVLAATVRPPLPELPPAALQPPPAPPAPQSPPLASPPYRPFLSDDSPELTADIIMNLDE